MCPRVTNSVEILVTIAMTKTVSLQKDHLLSYDDFLK